MEAIRYENSEIDERIIRAVTEIGYEEMTPIQQSAIPALLKDVTSLDRHRPELEKQRHLVFRLFR
ncbi:MAG: hypothetical protein ACLRZ6_05770 [Lachnospiraceae bacterium]